MSDTAKTTKATTVKSLAPCECSLWEFDLDAERDDDYSTGCTAMTHRTFAQGHDAKLVGFMVRAELAGHEISKRNGGMLVSFGGAAHAASSVSEALANKAEFQLSAALARIAKKASKPAKAPKVTVTETPKDRETTIKVGRWTYPATIDGTTSWATYTKKSGETVSIASTDYTEV